MVVWAHTWAFEQAMAMTMTMAMEHGPSLLFTSVLGPLDEQNVIHFIGTPPFYFLPLVGRRTIVTPQKHCLEPGASHRPLGPLIAQAQPRRARGPMDGQERRGRGQHPDRAGHRTCTGWMRLRRLFIPGSSNDGIWIHSATLDLGGFSTVLLYARRLREEDRHGRVDKISVTER